MLHPEGHWPRTGNVLCREGSETSWELPAVSDTLNMIADQITEHHFCHVTAAQGPGCQAWAGGSGTVPVPGMAAGEPGCSSSELCLHRTCAQRGISPSTGDTAISKPSCGLGASPVLLLCSKELSSVSVRVLCHPAPRGALLPPVLPGRRLCWVRAAQKAPLQPQKCYFSHHSSLAEGKASFLPQISAHKYRLYCVLLSYNPVDIKASCDTSLTNKYNNKELSWVLIHLTESCPYNEHLTEKSL